MKLGTIYPIAGYPGKGAPRSAVWTGEYRPPKAGELYLSGAIVAAYRAPNDLGTAYHIARPVRTHTVTVIDS